MNLAERYAQDENTRHTIINSKELDTTLNGELLDGHHAINSNVYTHPTAIFADTIVGSYDGTLTTAMSNVATVSALDQIESRVANLESVTLNGFAISEAVTPLVITPMTAVFQGSEYEIILADGSIIRASNFQVREIRDEQ